jgi:hypothetical protein
MDAALDLTGYAHALGRVQAAWRFGSAELRRAAPFATISAAWDTFRRDAGAGAVGPAHEAKPAPLLLSEDPRRDSVLVWLTDHGAAEIAEAAATITRMVGATRRFGARELALLDAARDALAHPVMASGPIRTVISGKRETDTVLLETLHAIAGAVDRLRRDVGFREGEGVEARHSLPRGTLRRYVAAEPAGCWALNLALLSSSARLGTLPAPGLVSRVLFRSDLEPEVIAAQLADGARLAWSAAYDRLVRLEPELGRGLNALAHLSRNARTRAAWLLVAELGICTRTQLARALGLSRAGADIQARTLADAGLATLGTGGMITWARPGREDRATAPLDHGPLGDAVSDLDASLAEIDRLLARTTR